MAASNHHRPDQVRRKSVPHLLLPGNLSPDQFHTRQKAPTPVSQLPRKILLPLNTHVQIILHSTLSLFCSPLHIFFKQICLTYGYVKKNRKEKHFFEKYFYFFNFFLHIYFLG
nr:MAG TPA: hypothetical protein [Caudoviricetes sp.]